MAARNRTSKTLIIGAGAFILIAGAAWIGRMFLSADSQAPSVVQTPSSEREAAATADRPEETVQALAGSVESIRTRIGELGDRASAGLDSIREEIAAMEKRLLGEQAEQRENAVLDAARIQTSNERLIQDLQTRIDGLESRQGTDYPVEDPVLPARGVLGQDGLLWHAAPDPGTAAAEPAWQAVTEQWSLGNIPAFRETGLVPPEDEARKPVPAYTIPAEATLVRARGLTALIGRVPIDGHVTDPMPFKVLVGQDNLLANGQRLPEVQRAIFSGVAFGDATLHCVTGRIEQATFIFADGGIASYPEEGDSQSQALGYIADGKGYPCVKGRYVSNLNEMVGKVTASSFASGLAQAYSEKQVGVTQDGSRVTRSITGNLGEYALGQGVAEGINQWARIIAERAAEAFDVVVVNPGQELTLHIQQTIPVDWAPDGRKLRHIAAIDADRYVLGGLD